MSIERIRSPLPGERVLALSPPDRAAAAETWLRRPNMFPGRALTAPTLEGRSAWAAGRLAQRGQAFVAGVARGLELGWTRLEVEEGGPAEVYVQVGPGIGLAASGEDVVLVRPLESTLRALPVVAPPAVLEGGGFGGGGVLQPRDVGPSLGEMRDELPDALPPAGILVLQPTTVDVRGLDPDDPCEVGCGDAVDFEDVRVADAVRLLWYAWPEDWSPLPPNGPRLRNQLAYTVFEAEGALAEDEMLPWEAYGVPLGLAVLDGEGVPTFVDRHSVARHGGHGRSSRLYLGPAGLVGGPRMPTMWQARVEQLAEEIAAAGDPAPDPDDLAARFGTLPPCGLLPRNAVDFTRFRSAFFPAATDLDAVPIPVDQLDLAFQESAGLAPLSLARGERVRILVPVDAASWDPRLLWTETLDPEFTQTLDRFLMERARALAGRQATRLKSAVLVEALKGEAPPVPAIGDDPEAVEPEALGAWGPPAGAGGGHRSELRRGLHEHGFEGATDTLTPAAGESLFTWVFLDPDAPPRTLLLEWRGPRGAVHRAYWGENLIDRGTDGRVTRLRMGDLPPAGRWVRLAVTAAQVDFQDAALHGMGFVLWDGRAAFSSAGAAGAEGERVWFDGTPPAGAETDGDEPFDELGVDDLLAPFDADFGVRPAEELVGVVSAAMEDLADDVRITSLLSDAEQAELPARGIDGFIRYLSARADRADDLVDYGFLKVQTDIYRIRQLVLDTSEATRLAVSPTLAGIAKAETAAASQQRISTFFSDLKARSPQPEPEPEDEPEDDGGDGGAAGGGMLFNTSLLRFPLVFGTGGGGISGSLPIIRETTSTRTVEASTISQPLFKASVYTPLDITNAAPLVGNFDVRTVSIAERLEVPKAREARDYATSTRHEAVLGLIRLADELVAEDGEVPGLFDEIDVWGLMDEEFTTGGDTVNARMTRPLAAFIDPATRGDLLAQILRPPQRDQSDEAAFFSDSADLADRTVALLRQVEGRVRRYRAAIAACEAAAALVRADLAALGKRERTWAELLGEARHDVSVARALIAEEQERLDGVNARRAQVLEGEVTFLAYARPRTADLVGAAPSRALDPGLLEAPVPVCLREGGSAPDELEAILEVVREAPADWFRLQHRLLDGLLKVESLLDAVRTAQIRRDALQTRVTALPAAGRLTAAMRTLQVRQATRLDAVRARSLAIDVGRLRTESWKSVRARAAEVVSLGDLIDGSHRNVQVTRNAAAFFERFGRITGCLHEAFSGVPASIRLDWAEILSEFDADANLRNLSSLPRFSEMEYVDRRRLQGLVDWLFDQVEPREPRARDLVDDVVRVCLLLASHAPVGRILAGRLPRPVRVRPGLRVPLVAADPGRLRVGMHALMYRGSQVVARAVVEDFAREEASARVTFAVGAEVELGTDVRVHFTESAHLGLR